MRRIPFRYIFPVVSIGVAALLLFVPSWQASRERDRGEVGVGWGEVDFNSPPLATEFVRAMYFPAAVVVAPVLISGRYLTQVYPIYGSEIGIFCLAIAALASFLQWYWIGWLLEGQLGYRIASANRALSKRGRILNSLAIAIAAFLGLVGALVAFQPGELHLGIISVLWAFFCVAGLLRWRHAQDDRSPKATQLSLR